MSDQPITILLHGLGRDRDIMLPIEKSLNDAGFDVCNLSYPSQRHPIAYLSNKIARHLETSFGRISFNFVTHSLGSIILRYMSAHKIIAPPKKVMMLGPPNHGTAVINLLRHLPGFTRIYGPAALELATDSPLFKQLPAHTDFTCQIIAGTHSIDPWFSWTVLKGPDDGKVTVESTKLDNLQAHITLPVAHRHLPASKQVHVHIMDFMTQR